jgi:cytochrome bd-type quinol oxidase subunit 2
VVRLYYRIKKAAAVSLMGLFLFSLFGGISLAQTQSKIQNGTCNGINLATGGTAAADGTDCDGKTSTDGSTFAGIITNVINILSILVGAVSVIMLIVGGFRYIISNGDSNSTKGAKDTIMYALIGLIIVLFAQVIVRFVWTNASGSTTEGGSGSTPGSGFMLNNLIK